MGAKNVEDIKKKAKKIGSQFAVSRNGSGYASTHGETHDTFRTDKKGKVSDYHTSTEVRGKKKLSRWHQK